jgi:DNA adenine methylase
MTEPFLKWAGGKRWLASSDEISMPSNMGKYIEPFLGGGAMFFRTNPSSARLSDVNRDLIDLYEVIRDSPADLVTLMELHQSAHNDEYYYSVRDKDLGDKISRAARFLYLNRTCWNGLYRVNLSGKFNVPRGTKQIVISAGEDFLEASESLKKAEIACCDFEDTINLAQSNDFVFVDPPYTVKHNLNGFVKYNEKLFSWDDQIRLRDALVRASGRGAFIAMTNADHESVRELYEGKLKYRPLTRTSVLAANASKRGKTTEALFTGNL